MSAARFSRPGSLAPHGCQRVIRFKSRKQGVAWAGARWLARTLRAGAMALLLCAGPGAAQDGWGDLDTLIARHIGAERVEGGNVWIPDNADPALATRALAFYYFIPPNGGNAIRLNVGLFRKGATGFDFAGPVTGLFGMDPSDPVFTPAAVELTTITTGPNDPRCCPTLSVRWRVDLQTLQAMRLP